MGPAEANLLCPRFLMNGHRKPPQGEEDMEVVQLQSAGSWVHTDGCFTMSRDASENNSADTDSPQSLVPAGLTGADNDGSQVCFLE